MNIKLNKEAFQCFITRKNDLLWLWHGFVKFAIIIPMVRFEFALMTADVILL